MNRTPSELLKWLRGLPSKITSEMMAVERENLRDARQAAESLSHGKYSQAELNRLGNPYATAHPNPPQDPAIINEHPEEEGGAGLFASSWQEEGPTLTQNGKRIDSRAVNMSREGHFLLGTKKMIARPLAAAVLKEIMPAVQRRRRTAVESALKPR